MKSLLEMQRAVTNAKILMINELERRWPRDSTVAVLLSCSQQTPTHGRVTDHNGDGFIHVRIDTAKENSRRPVRAVHFSNILSFGEREREREQRPSPRPSPARGEGDQGIGKSKAAPGAEIQADEPVLNGGRRG